MESSIDQWTYFIKNAENLTIIPESVKDEGLKEAYIEASQQNWTQLELDDYLRASIKERDEIGRIEFAIKKAEKKAEIKGEIKRNLEVAKSLKDNGVAIDIISKSTGLSIEEIEKL